MVTDYERAWIRLQAHVAGKTQHGREGLLQAMAELAEECQVPGGELPRLLRLYGVEVARAAATQSGPSDSERFQEQKDRAFGIAEPGPVIDRGGHDGISNGSSAAGNGRRIV